jgi:hypothetical protein
MVRQYQHRQLSVERQRLVYDKIIADLEYAVTWLPNTTTSRAIPSKAAAHSYLALVCLTMSGNTDNAVLLAKAL